MKHLYIKRLTRSILLVGILLIATLINAAPKFNIPTTVKQPDGSILNCFASGDEFHNWLHDANGYTIIQHPETGYYVYAVEAKGKLIATDYIAGKFDPATKGLKPFANISPAEIQKKREQYRVPKSGIDIHNAKGSDVKNILYSGTATEMNNIVVFIRFSDDNSVADNYSYYNDIYNASTASVKDYYLNVTYNQFTINSSFYPAPSGGNVVWYNDANPRNYYRPYNAATNTIGYDPNIDYTNSTNTSGKTYREHTLLKNAVNAIASSVTGINMDINGDNYIDCISFIVGGTNDTWNDLLWPHQWSLWSQNVYIGTKKVGDYTFQLQYYNAARIDLGTLCHEMFHVLGAPDLYRYDQNATINPMGRWDIMCNTLDYPQQMTSYMKQMYGGWLSNTSEITTTGTYTLNPLGTPIGTGVKYAFRIPSPFTHTEYFWVEYRKLEGYDAGLPGQGLLVYRINSRLEGNGNADGPPDEIYVFRYNGTPTVNATTYDAYFNSTVGRTLINDSSNPYCFLSDGSAGGLKLSNIGAAGTTISFDATIDFVPLVVLKNDNGASSSIGNGTIPFSVASRFMVSDLTNLVGRHITKVDYFINSGSGTNVTIKIWEVNAGAYPTTPVYQKSISSEIVFDQLSTHSLSQSVEIKANKEYWIGYSIVPTGGYPVVTDKGPMILNKGGWVEEGGSWTQLNQYGINKNVVVRAVVSTTSVAVPSEEEDAKIAIQNYPNPCSNATTFRFSIKQPGNVRLTIHNIIGQEVGVVADNHFGSGDVEIPFNAINLSSGVYFYTFKYQEDGIGETPIMKTEKLLILK